MHDLHTIRRLNAEAADAAGIHDARRRGQYVVALFAGLALVSFTTFDSASAAAEAAQAPTDASERRVVYGPITGPARDQSEDYAKPLSLDQLAALGRRSAGDPAPTF